MILSRDGLITYKNIFWWLQFQKYLFKYKLYKYHLIKIVFKNKYITVKNELNFYRPQKKFIFNNLIESINRTS